MYSFEAVIEWMFEFGVVILALLMCTV